MEGDLIDRPSREGLTGLEDVKPALQVHHEILPHIFITPPICHHVVLRLVDYMILQSDDEDMAEHMEEDPNEDLEEDTEEAPEEDPKEDSEEDD